MRPIKFRAWFEDCKAYLPVKGFDFDVGAIYFSDYPSRKLGLVTLLQFTGLCDKQDREIYEGDILQREPPNDRIHNKFLVDWSNEMFQYLLVDPRNSQSVIGWFNDDCKTMEIIGNKFENPELTWPLPEKEKIT